MEKGSCIINTASVAAYQGNKDLIDYSATKGAIATLPYGNAPGSHFQPPSWSEKFVL